MAYDLDAIKRKIADLSGGKTGGKKVDRPKFNWFKPQIGKYEVRFLPYQDANGQPFQEVSYYDNKMLSEHRFVAPAQFGCEDPIFDLLNELRKDKSKETWRLIGTLRPKERFYAPVLIRGEEDKGVQIWEMNSKVLKDIYSILAHPDNVDEDLMDADKGYDFTLAVSDSGKKWNGYMIKSLDLQLRRKSSKLATTKAARDELVAAVPDLEGYFRDRVRAADWLETVVENFLASRAEGEEGEETIAAASAAVERSATRSTPANNNAKEVKSIEEAFADLDDEEDPF
jgi:hypothetical protein